MGEDGPAQPRYQIPASARGIDASCDRFEADWHAGHRPRIEDHLAAIDGSRRGELLRELLLLEIELARAVGEAPAPAPYHERFPSDADLVDAAFDRADRPDGDEPRDDHDPVDLAPGTAIARYVVLARLDEGGEALLYRVLHAELGKPFVLKLSRRPIAAGNGLAAQGRLLAELDHPRLVKVVDLDVHEGRPFLVMEYVPGLNLGQYAAQRRPDARRAAALVADLARTVAFLHRRGIIHQDIKPRNILIDESDRPRLIDFGQAQLRHAWSETREGTSGGTPAYMAPEQADGRDDRITTRTDVFGLGAVLYELLTGRPPYRAPTASALAELARAGRVIPPRQVRPARAPQAGVDLPAGHGPRAGRPPCRRRRAGAGSLPIPSPLGRRRVAVGPGLRRSGPWPLGRDTIPPRPARATTCPRRPPRQRGGARSIRTHPRRRISGRSPHRGSRSEGTGGLAKEPSRDYAEMIVPGGDALQSLAFARAQRRAIICLMDRRGHVSHRAYSRGGRGSGSIAHVRCEAGGRRHGEPIDP